MQHGSKNIANEKKLLREINSSKKKKIRTTTIEELDVPIKKKNDEIENSHLYLYTTDFEGINEEMKRLEMVKQKAVANAAVGGKLWSSLGTKKDIQQQVNVMYEELDELRLKQIETRNETKYGEKKLRIVQKQILFLHKQLE
ncbi:proton pump-interactor 1-like [Cucumis melo var. makuwa]|nr:proton pump-interactor 1-like [Cucumis melo var. makuwa]TYK20697.1 proton pump-interactor 1-like [Cucumis melo var. makuwa]